MGRRDVMMKSEYWRAFGKTIKFGCANCGWQGIEVLVAPDPFDEGNLRAKFGILALAGTKRNVLAF